MQIKITSAVGSGPTSLAAFDAALRKAGIETYNLIPLSSVIPASAQLQRARFVAPPSEYGHRLYVVMARHDATQIGEEAWAGLGVVLHRRDRRSEARAAVERALHLDPEVQNAAALRRLLASDRWAP